MHALSHMGHISCSELRSCSKLQLTMPRKLVVFYISLEMPYIDIQKGCDMFLVKKTVRNVKIVNKTVYKPHTWLLSNLSSAILFSNSRAFRKCIVAMSMDAYFIQNKSAVNFIFCSLGKLASERVNQLHQKMNRVGLLTEHGKY